MSDDVQVLIDNVDRTNRLINSSLRWTEYEGGQTGAMSLEIEDVDDNLLLFAWQQVVVKIGLTAVWGGYIMRSLPGLTEGGNRRWSLQCESWDTLLNRTPIVRCTYANQTPAWIIIDLFSRAGLNDFDIITQVDPNLPAIQNFVASGEKLTDLLDRLALLAGASWSISVNKELIFRVNDSLPVAPFAIKALGLADFTTSFPPSGSPTPDIDATDLRNRITVYGGIVPSAIQTDICEGDGTTTRFTLLYAPVHEIVKITVDGVLQWHGYDYYDTQFNDYDCLVDYTLGTVRWLDAPVDGAVIEIQYRYKQQLMTVRQSDISYMLFGRWFDFELRDSTLTTEPACIAAADALLAEYAFPAIGASLDVEWFGPRAGQRIEVEMPSLGLTSYYIIRQATIELARSTKRALVSLKVGGRSARLSRVIGGDRGAGSMIGPGAVLPAQPNPSLSGEIDLLRVRDRIEIIDRNTVFVSPNDYGNATGLVLLFDAVAQQGRLLGLSEGALQAYFDHDGTIKWNAGAGVLDSAGASIGNSVFGAAGIQLQYNYGNPRAYIGDGDGNFFLFDGADAQFGGMIYAASGHFSGSVYVGTANPRILIDGANKRIESTNYLAGTSGFRLAGATGDAEFNNATMRGAIYAASGHFSGSVYVGTANPRILIDGVNKRIESTNFASGTSGFRIEGATGNAEFNDIVARGAIASAVFTYSQIQATAGEIIVAKGAGKLKQPLVLGGVNYAYIQDPPGISHAAAGTLWATLDTVRVKDPGIGDTWLRVLNVIDGGGDVWILYLQFRNGTNLVTYPAGGTLVNYGGTGQGFVRISADGANAPYVSLATHSGLPWSFVDEKARLGNLSGISGASGYGLWTNNGFFTGTVHASAGSIAGWTIAAGLLSASGVGLRPADYPFYAGDNDPSSAPFRVTQNGALVATNATITGAVTASSGQIGSWTINNLYLARDTGSNSNSSGMAPNDYPFYAGATYANRASAPFRVDPAGGLYATAGSVGGFTISYSDGLFSGTGATRVQMRPGWGFWAGATARDSAPFRVTQDGALVASNATITGAITASSGSITGALTMGASGKITGGSAWELNQGGLLIADNVTAVQFGGVTSYMKLWTSGSYGGSIDCATYPLGLNTGRDLSLNANAGNFYGGSVRLKNNGNTLVQVGNNTLGFFGVTPIARPAAYTFTNGTSDRAINCDSTTIGELADVVYTMWSDLKSLGLLQ